MRTATEILAKQVGRFIKDQLHRLKSDDILTKDLNSLVSYVDIEAEKLIVSGLKELLPQADFLTEEKTIVQNQKTASLQWIIDPLDGTTNFIHDLPFFSVSIALKQKDSYLLGVVYDVMHDVLFSAVKSQGAYANGKPIVVTEEGQLKNVVLATGFPYNSFDAMERYLSLFRKLFQATRGIRRFGSAALDLCYVAKGSFAGFFEYGLNEWDIAAGICIVEEAGGEVSDFHGQQNVIHDKTILATNSQIHNEMLTYIRTYFNNTDLID